MRLDQFLPAIGIIKRRTEAKRLSDNGLISVNGKTSKPSYTVKVNDIIEIGGSKPQKIETLEIPTGSVKKDDRQKYYRSL